MVAVSLVQLLLIAGGYLAGGIPFGVIIARKLGVDIEQRGSGNIGATNVTRVLGAIPGAIVLVLDVAKGAIPVAVALGVWSDPWIVVATGGAAILGHCFSPFLEFRGGKGVATAFGVFLVLAPKIAGVGVLVFLLVLRLTRVTALGSLAGMLAVATIQLARGDRPGAVLAVATFGLLFYKHRENLAKLRGSRP